MTTQDVANEINQLKPDLKEFWQQVNNSSGEQIYELLSKDSNVALFQAELLLIYAQIRPNRYFNYKIREKLKTFLNNRLSNAQLPEYKTADDFVNQYGNYSKFISGNVTDLRNYLNPYLIKKLGFTKSKSKDIKSLQDNLFSVELFKNSLGKRKLPSTEVSNYFRQFRNFSPEIRDQFMDIVFKHCQSPSKKLQQEIENSGIFSYTREKAKSKFISLPRYRMKWTENSKNLPLPEALFNDRDSEHTPFICGVPRKPTPTDYEVASLVGILIIVQNSDSPDKEYIVKCLKDHLSHPAYGTLYTDYIANLKAYANSILDLAKEV